MAEKRYILPVKCSICKQFPVYKCSSCKKAYYCGKMHQKVHWSSHKRSCSLTGFATRKTDVVPETYSKRQSKVWNSWKLIYSLDRSGVETLEELSSRLVISLKMIGFCVIENSVNVQLAERVLQECMLKYEDPLQFSSGEVSKDNMDSNKAGNERVRQDDVYWLQENDVKTPNIMYLVKFLDQVAMYLTMSGKLERCDIRSRTKPMISCFPGNGTCYKRHVDNPNKDGRRLTFTYYLNKNYVRDRDGGILRIHKENSQTFDLEPHFGRLVIFWSDSRTVHEVLPCYSSLLSITVWYFDALERAIAANRHCHGLGITLENQECKYTVL